MTEQAFIARVFLGVLLGGALVLGLMATLDGRRPWSRRGLPPATRRQRDRAARAARLRLPSDEQRGIPPAREDFDLQERNA